MTPAGTEDRFELVRLPAGAWALRDRVVGEIMHPGCGPGTEAERLYVQQLRLPQRFAEAQGQPVVVWDVGLGGAANAITILRAAAVWPVRLRLISFDTSLAALHFARRQAARLEYLAGWEPLVDRFLRQQEIQEPVGAAEVHWTFVPGDFATRIAEPDLVLPPPHAIAYDPFSPRRNPELWTLRTFQQLFRRLDPAQPCLLATYSRSSRVRVALLLAGFFVGRGCPVGVKEETTVAANTPQWLEEPLDCGWLARVRQSTAAEPARSPDDPPRPLEPLTWEKLLCHPQFANPPRPEDRPLNSADGAF